MSIYIHIKNMQIFQFKIKLQSGATYAVALSLIINHFRSLTSKYWSRINYKRSSSFILILFSFFDEFIYLIYLQSIYFFRLSRKPTTQYSFNSVKKDCIAVVFSIFAIGVRAAFWVLKTFFFREFASNPIQIDCKVLAMWSFQH